MCQIKLVSHDELMEKMRIAVLSELFLSHMERLLGQYHGFTLLMPLAAASKIGPIEFKNQQTTN